MKYALRHFERSEKSEAPVHRFLTAFEMTEE